MPMKTKKLLSLDPILPHPFPKLPCDEHKLYMYNSFNLLEPQHVYKRFGELK